MNNEKRIELEGKVLFIKKAPATVAYDTALRYRDCLEKGDMVGTQDCLYELLKYAELDLGDGRRVKLDHKEIINQHFQDAKSLFVLQKTTVEHNFGFFGDDAV